MGRQAEDCRDADTFLRGGGSGIFRGGYEDAHAGRPSAVCMNPGRNTISCSVWLAGRGPGNRLSSNIWRSKMNGSPNDVKRLDDKKVYEYLQGHWIVEDVGNECGGECQKH